MSIKIVKEEIKRFLNSSFPEVLSIRGDWGIGKTYAWKRILAEAKESKEIKLKHYSYVSLFGINSLAQLKQSIYENMVSNNSIGEEPSLETYTSYIRDSLITTGKKSSKTIYELIKYFLPVAKSFSPLIDSLSFFTVKESIICLDDFERKGDNLSTKEILGLISQLKESKNCKVVFIYNEKYLNETDQNTYKELKEKVIDTEILFSPSSSESINITFKDSDLHYSNISRCSNKLNILNIRILMKIKRLVFLINELLTNHPKEILEQAINTIVLGCNILYSKDPLMPDLEWVKSFNYGTQISLSDKKADSNNQMKKWCSLLQEYGYLNTDQFDLAILDAVNHGYFDKNKVMSEADKVAKRITASKSVNSFRDAWKLFHNSLSDNQEEFISALMKGFTENCKYLTPIDLNSSVVVLKNLNKENMANQLIDLYIKEMRSEISLYDLSNTPFKDHITDSYLIQEFTKIFVDSKPQLSLLETLETISKSYSWSQDQLKYLEKLTVEDYYKFYKEFKGDSLGALIKASFMVKIDNSNNALVKIAKETPLNAMRLDKFGIKAP